MEELIFKKILKDINREIKSKKQTCLFPDCQNLAINSHLMQRNGVLDNITSDNNQVIELTNTDVFDWSENSSPISIKKIGVKKAFSLSLFCNTHDTTIFKEIEEPNYIFDTHRGYMLLTYRAICAELKKKLDSNETFKLLLNSEVAKEAYDIYQKLKVFKRGIDGAIVDLTKIKMKIENELFHQAKSPFRYSCNKYKLIPISASAVFTPNYDNLLVHCEIGQVPAIYIHIVPQKNHMCIIVGYDSDSIPPEGVDYVEAWSNLNDVDLTIKLSKLVSCYIETWCCQPSYYDSIDLETKTKFLTYWRKNALNFSPHQKIDFNFFEQSI